MKPEKAIVHAEQSFDEQAAVHGVGVSPLGDVSGNSDVVWITPGVDLGAEPRGARGWGGGATQALGRLLARGLPWRLVAGVGRGREDFMHLGKLNLHLRRSSRVRKRWRAVLKFVDIPGVPRGSDGGGMPAECGGGDGASPVQSCARRGTSSAASSWSLHGVRRGGVHTEARKHALEEDGNVGEFSGGVFGEGEVANVEGRESRIGMKKVWTVDRWEVVWMMGMRDGAGWRIRRGIKQRGEM